MSPLHTANSLILGTLQELGLFEKARKYQVFSIWEQVVGKLAKNAIPRRFDGDTLMVATSSSVWSHELTFMSRSIASKLNQALGGEYVREIRFSEHLWEAASCGRCETANAERGARPLKNLLDRSSSSRSRSAGSDESLEKVFVRLKKTMEERKRQLIDHGYILCKECGQAYPPGKRECPFCRISKEFIWHNRAIASLERKPELTDRQIMKELGIGSPRVVGRARRELDNRLSLIIGNYLARGTGKPWNRVEIVEACRKLACLRTGSRFEDLREDDLVKALGRRFSSILKRE